MRARTRDGLLKHGQGDISVINPDANCRSHSPEEEWRSTCAQVGTAWGNLGLRSQGGVGPSR